MEHGPLRIVAMRDATGQVTSYHYMTLKVTNPGALARDWYPVVKALTDTERTYVAMGFEQALPAIRAQESNDDLVSIGTTKGKIQAGETLDTVAIFGPLDPLYDLVKVQLLGLADPIAIYKMSRYDVPVDLPDVVYMQAIEGEDGEYEKVTQGILIQDVAYVERNAKVTAAMHKELGTASCPPPRRSTGRSRSAASSR